jgi:Lar family restriction alleviation protein
MNELKPCPFCGNVPTFEYDRSRQCDFVYCSKCGVTTRQVTIYEDTASILTKEWNTRINQDPYIHDLEQQIEVLEMKNEELKNEVSKLWIQLLPPHMRKPKP